MPSGVYPRASLEDRVRSRIATVPNEFGCLLFTGCIGTSGYGRVTGRGASLLVHRVVWELEHGPIPDGMMVLHACEKFYFPGDVTHRRCTNHLYLGTVKENTRDMLTSGRVSHGERHYKALLDGQAVKRIQEEYMKYGSTTRRVLAALFRVKPSTIKSVQLGRSWRYGA